MDPIEVKMKYLLISILIGGLLAGCAPAASPAPGTPGTSAPNESLPATASEASGSASAVSQGSVPMIITVRPPMIPIVPIQGTPSFPVSGLGTPKGWQTFTSTALGVAIDYPIDWAAREQTGGVTFTSPQGATILLQSAGSASNSAIAGQSCSNLVNQHGLAADVCFDATTLRYSVVFLKSGAGSPPWLVLSTVSSEKPDVYYQMFDTLRPTTK